MGRVLRAEAGQMYELSDGNAVWLARIEEASKERVEFCLVEPVPVRVSSLDKTLLLAVVKFDAFEWALEKATELGVKRIVPLAATRSEKGLLAGAGKRAERWRKIVFEASQQSRRVKLPAVAEVAKPDTAFREVGGGLKVMLSEREQAAPLRETLRGGGESIALAVGPEGGWTDEEFAAAARAGFMEASLGGLILRTETAVTACLAAVNYALER